MRFTLLPLFLVVAPACSTMEGLLEAPMSLFVEDEETGEMVEVETTVGDAIADQSETVASVIGNALGGINPALGLLGAGAGAALLNGARRNRKKKAAATEESSEVS